LERIYQNLPSWPGIHKRRLPAAITRLHRGPKRDLGPRRQDRTSLPHGTLPKPQSIGGPRTNDEVGSAARERPQMKSINSTCMGHQLSVNVYNITNYLHP